MNIFSQYLRNGVLASLSLALFFVAFAPRVRAEEPKRPMKVWTYSGVNNKVVHTVTDGAKIHNASMYGEAYTGHTVKNVDFSHADMRGVAFYDMVFINCNFSNADMRGLYGGARFINCNFTDAKIAGAVNLGLTPDNLKQTYDFQQKELKHTTIHLILDSDYELDLSGFTIYKSDVATYTGPTGPKVKLKLTDARLYDTRCRFSEILDSRSFKERTLYGLTLSGSDFTNVDFSNFIIFNCWFGVGSPDAKYDGADFSNAVIVSTQFSGNLSIEQLKSTWNYQNGRYDWGPLPDDLEEQIDELLKREGREPRKSVGFPIGWRPLHYICSADDVPYVHMPLYYASPEEVERLMKAQKEARLARTESAIAELEARAASAAAPETK